MTPPYGALAAPAQEIYIDIETVDSPSILGSDELSDEDSVRQFWTEKNERLWRKDQRTWISHLSDLLSRNKLEWSAAGSGAAEDLLDRKSWLLRRLAAVRSCGYWVSFSFCGECGSLGNARARGTCALAVCGRCLHKKAKKQRELTTFLLEKMLKHGPRNPMHLVMTLKTQWRPVLLGSESDQLSFLSAGWRAVASDLGAERRRLIEAFSKLRNHQYWREGIWEIDVPVPVGGLPEDSPFFSVVTGALERGWVRLQEATPAEIAAGADRFSHELSAYLDTMLFKTHVFKRDGKRHKKGEVKRTRRHWRRDGSLEVHKVRIIGRRDDGRDRSPAPAASPWFWSFETTINLRGAGSGWEYGWHPHLHICCNTGWLDADLLRCLWLEFTGDSHNLFLRQAVKKGESASKAAAELSKYVTKGSDFHHKLDGQMRGYYGEDGQRLNGPLYDPSEIEKAALNWLEIDAFEEFLFSMRGQQNYRKSRDPLMVQWISEFKALEPVEESDPPCENCGGELVSRIMDRRNFIRLQLSNMRGEGGADCCFGLDPEDFISWQREARDRGQSFTSEGFADVCRSRIPEDYREVDTFDGATPGRVSLPCPD